MKTLKVSSSNFLRKETIHQAQVTFLEQYFDKQFSNWPYLIIVNEVSEKMKTLREPLSNFPRKETIQQVQISLNTFSTFDHISRRVSLTAYSDNYHLEGITSQDIAHLQEQLKKSNPFINSGHSITCINHFLTLTCPRTLFINSMF